MVKLYSILIALILCGIPQIKANIILNEMMPCNVSTLLDDKYNYSGWVELYNSGSSAVNLNGYSFTNTFKKADSGKSGLKTWKINSDITINAGEYKIFYFDELAEGLHASFKIKTVENDMKLLIYDASSNLVDQFSYTNLYPHVSWGKTDKGEGYMQNPTPGKANSNGVSSNIRLAAPSFSITPGIYNANISLSLTSSDNAQIYYTTDGSDPTEKSAIYTKPISMTGSSVVRARAYQNGRICSETATGTYIFADSYHSECGGFTLPIISITTNPDNFFSDNIGIYTKGKNGVSGTSFCDSQSDVANYYQDWKRPVNFEYFVDGKQVVCQEMEAAVMGGCSRSAELKSLKISASNKTGNSSILSEGSNEYYNFFPNKKGTEYKSIQIRNGGNDYSYSRIRDGFMQTLTEGTMGVDYQAYQPVAYFINGKYYGQMDLRERTNKDYIYTNYGLEDDEIDLIEISKEKVQVTEGSINAYDTLIAHSHNYTSENYYKDMSRLMDMDEYMDYQILEQYVVNTDWPANNCKLWRATDKGRFRWIIYDTDFGFGLYGDGANNHTSENTNMLLFAMGEGDRYNWANGTSTGSGFSAPDESDVWKVILFRNLMKNEEFKEKFLNKFLIHLGTTFETDRVLSVLDSVYSNAEAEICAHWKKYSPNYNSYSDQKGAMTNFAKKRADVVYDNLKSYYGLGDAVSLSISSNISDADFIMNGTRLNAPRFNGKYFKGMDLSIVPVAPTGYKFKSWNISSSISSSILGSSSQWKYYYKGDSPASDWFSSSYDDSAWNNGSGKMGYAKDNSTYNTVLDFGPDSNNKYITAYFRTSFNVDEPDNLDGIKASLVYDDGVIIYVNGKEACRYNMEEGDVSYSTVAITYKNDESVTFSLDKSLFTKGTNVIAIEVHQNVETSSDLTFQFGMSGVINDNSKAVQAYNKTVTDDVTLVATFEKASITKPTIIINELCSSSNKNSGNPDEFGNYGDWIELYNYGTEDIDLAGLYLTDDISNLGKSQIPANEPNSTTIKAGEHKIIWADNAIWQGALHADFKLSATETTTVALTMKVDQVYSIIDTITYQKMETNQSYGRRVDKDDEWTIFGLESECNLYTATPASANGTKYCEEKSEAKEATSTNAAFALYPNPAKGQLNITVPATGIYEITIYDAQGNERGITTCHGTDTITLDVSRYEPGFYIIGIASEQGITKLNLMIMR
ncbi:MAG: CotH kinase family protein [Paludibacteraceae bacterium]|nr:CotH kinase family protein [Prevotellaceae bacterium]